MSRFQYLMCFLSLSVNMSFANHFILRFILRLFIFIFKQRPIFFGIWIVYYNIQTFLHYEQGYDTVTNLRQQLVYCTCNDRIMGRIAGVTC